MRSFLETYHFIYIFTVYGIWSVCATFQYEVILYLDISSSRSTGFSCPVFRACARCGKVGMQGVVESHTERRSMTFELNGSFRNESVYMKQNPYMFPYWLTNLGTEQHNGLRDGPLAETEYVVYGVFTPTAICSNKVTENHSFSKTDTVQLQ